MDYYDIILTVFDYLNNFDLSICRMTNTNLYEFCNNIAFKRNTDLTIIKCSEFTYSDLIATLTICPIEKRIIAACMINDIELVKSFGICNYSYQLLLISAMKGSIDVLDHISKYIDYRDQKIATIAAIYGQCSVLKYLYVTKYFAISVDTIRQAAKYGQLECLKFLMSISNYRYDIKISILDHALKNGHINCVLYMKELINSAILNVYHLSGKAVKYKQFECLKILCQTEHIENIKCAFYLAAFYKYSEYFEYLYNEYYFDLNDIHLRYSLFSHYKNANCLKIAHTYGMILINEMYVLAIRNDDIDSLTYLYNNNCDYSAADKEYFIVLSEKKPKCYQFITKTL